MDKHTEKTARKDARTSRRDATKNTNTATGGISPRIDRWRKLAEERVARLEALRHPGLALLRTCAEIEGTTPASLIVDRLTAQRGGGKIVTEKPDGYSGPEWEAFIDTDYEQNTPTRTRNNHEREIVNHMEFNFTFSGIPEDMLKNHGRAFLLRYYHKGDNGVHPAFLRLVSDALSGLKSAAN